MGRVAQQRVFLATKLHASDQPHTLIPYPTYSGLVAMSAGQGILNTEPCNGLTIGEVADALNYTVLGDLLDATKLYNALNGTRYTLLAPRDAAFVNLLTALKTDVETLLKFPTVVADLLKYHVVNSTNVAGFLANQVRGCRACGVVAW